MGTMYEGTRICLKSCSFGKNISKNCWWLKGDSKTSTTTPVNQQLFSNTSTTKSTKIYSGRLTTGGEGQINSIYNSSIGFSQVHSSIIQLSYLMMNLGLYALVTYSIMVAGIHAPLKPSSSQHTSTFIP